MHKVIYIIAVLFNIIYYCIIVEKIRVWYFEKEKYMIKRTTISLSDVELKQLRELAKVEHRPISRQIIYMMEFYKKQKWSEKNMVKIFRCIYCGRKFITEEILKDHMIKFGTHV